MALPPDFIAHHSTYLENLLEHRFLFDIGRALLKREPKQLVNILQSEVDAFGVDLVLSVEARTVHVQMKARSGAAHAQGYRISEKLWSVTNPFVIWMIYDPTNIEVQQYRCLNLSERPPEAFALHNRPIGSSR